MSKEQYFAFVCFLQGDCHMLLLPDNIGSNDT